MSKHPNHPGQEGVAPDATAETASSNASVDQMAADLSAAKDAVTPEDAPIETPPVEDLSEVLKKAEAEAAELRDAFLRARAETENVRRQAREEADKIRKYSVEKFAREMLGVKDALEAALSSDHASVEQLRQGVELTLKSLNAAFEKAQIVEENPQDKAFDPHKHQAIQAVASDAPANQVVQVFQKGYMIYDRVLRPAMVVVSKSKAEG